MDNKKAIAILQAVRANTANAFIAKVAIREALDMAIAALEQQEKGRWIPVTERLPEETDEVLTTYINNGNREKRYVETATYYSDDGEGTWLSPWDEYRVAGTVVEVLAWRPLPEPYQEDEA